MIVECDLARPEGPRVSIWATDETQVDIDAAPPIGWEVVWAEIPKPTFQSVAGQRGRIWPLRRIRGAEQYRCAVAACGVCGLATDLISLKRCYGCLDVEKGLSRYLRDGGAKAAAFVAEALTDALTSNAKSR